MDSNFIKSQILEDQEKNPVHSSSPIRFRFPPEPNGFLHLGHAKAICLNYSLAQEFNGTCHLRFDDTNPSSENPDFYDKIWKDLAWLGFLTDANTTCSTSDHFDQLYEWAIQLITSGNAYVCDCSAEEMAELRRTDGVPGTSCSDRSRTVDENMDLFTKMRKGEFPDGSKTLRAKIDLASKNLNMRDPVMYRIMHIPHHNRTGNAWCIYPSYDWAHGQSDAIEEITYSICTLEFEQHRPLYNWFLERLGINNPPTQIEFARLNLGYTLMSKRKLKQMIDTGLVSGWDDPRLPTLSGLRRRGFTPKAIYNFCQAIGVSKTNSVISLALLESAIRDDLNESAPRRLVVTDPVKLIIENYDENKVEWFEVPNHPQNESFGTRKIPFRKELWIEREDFMEEAPKKYYRLKPGQEVRLRYAYYVTCTGCKRDPETGELLCVTTTYDPNTRGGTDPGGRKVKGIIHWVSVPHAIPAKLKIIKPLFTSEVPSGVEDYDTVSMELLLKAKMEPFLGFEAKDALKQIKRVSYQFERKGYFCLDLEDTTSEGSLVFNRVVSLKDSWGKIKNKK